MATLRMVAGTLSAAVIGMTYVYLGGSLPFNNYLSDCPHEMFVNKHLCVDCKTLQDALEFSRNRQSYGDTNVNTVFFSSSVFESKKGDRELVCVNTTPLRAVKCTLSSNHCYEMGSNCIGKHAVSNGHLFYHEI
ncbi:unnamed protein product [Lepeophtheirus salmonis]|uniref:(salmon louse) hypothetical protein n=1 Tax=Lepeophtheirus salmonis TaxID=72036 RepID=A0A7R8CVJ7_LEPSM|nr:uncharacterized protein LOC121116290 isoform X2 [Lepeophtheirus salmonis]CAB4062869.1 unnamed protein product [Lepeophtheirus salmonis]CAF2912772.1 unnamed protein product [Lepeophtheirus salmonis]